MPVLTMVLRDWKMTCVRIHPPERGIIKGGNHRERESREDRTCVRIHPPERGGLAAPSGEAQASTKKKE